ncbi:zinc finger domain-containing protein [Serinibacter salmoneus]|uniref:zinc finger domain-containing protein n=1 Tax=Serinibacter salmoneus TaxID=556530 RepID=UPI000BF25BFF
MLAPSTRQTSTFQWDVAYFDRRLAVYGQGGRPCPRCGTLVVRQSFANRSSHLCPRCQRR